MKLNILSFNSFRIKFCYTCFFNIFISFWNGCRLFIKSSLRIINSLVISSIISFIDLILSLALTFDRYDLILKLSILLNRLGLRVLLRPTAVMLTYIKTSILLVSVWLFVDQKNRLLMKLNHYIYTIIALN